MPISKGAPSKRSAFDRAFRRCRSGAKSEVTMGPSSAGFIRCYAEGPRMTEADATLDFDELVGGLPSSSNGQLPQDTEFAERIIRRLKPENQQQMFDLAARQSKIGGMLITLMVVVWWLFIGVDQDDMGAGVSVFFGLDFGQ